MGRPFRVTFYCPDRHLEYNGRTPDERGVGGGVTARLRLSTALARRGNQVDVICNSKSEETVDGVRFLPLDKVDQVSADIFVMHTTGDKLDLHPVLGVGVEAAQRIVLVDGIDAPKGWEKAGMQRLYACSNFIGCIARDKWGIPASQIFVTHHGVMRRYFEPTWLGGKDRHPYRIAYATHPSKGLEAAQEVVRRLRKIDERFELHVFGGTKLWGQPEQAGPSEPGIVYHGLLGQKELAKRLLECGFALYLQNRLEPFGIAITEALAAGCITVASDIGAHSEIIDDGLTGFLVEGDASSEAVHAAAINIIATVVKNEPFAAQMRARAQASPLDWDTVAATWEQYWTEGLRLESGRRCPKCKGEWLLLADGYHCSQCGFYSRGLR